MRLGPVYVTPTLQIGQVGYDSNVFYTASDRTGDFVADGGPGLELLLPLGQRSELAVRGGLDYLWFAETESQRRTTWLGSAALRLEGARTRAALGGEYTESFRRPQFEVDERVPETNQRAHIEIARDIGRNEVVGRFEARRIEIEEDQVFAGADLARNLNRSVYRGLLGVHLGLTPKTSFLVEADYQVDEFLLLPSRDADSIRAYAGFLIESETRLSGRAVAGARHIRPRSGAGARWYPYVSVALSYRPGFKTALGLRVDRDQDFSAFAADAGDQTSSRLTSELALGRHLWGPFDLRVFGGLRQLETGGAIRLETEIADSSPMVRKDDEWYGGANLGVRFRNWFRVGFEARYSDRNSSFDDFGVEGLLLGVTVRATPGDIIDLIAQD